MTKLEELARSLGEEFYLWATVEHPELIAQPHYYAERIRTELEAALKPLLEEMYDLAETLDDLGGDFAGLVIKLRPMLAEWYEPDGHERGER